MYRNIIWDVDGTLFDTYPAIAGAFQAALNDLGFTAPLSWIDSLARQSLDHCFATLAEKYAVGEDALGRAFDEQYAHLQPGEQPPFPGVKAVCEYIRSIGGRNVIVTHRGRKGLLELLAAHRMTDYFAGFLTHDDGYPKKPDPAAMRAILQAYTLPPAETIAVGDREIDILAGLAAGLFTCLFCVKIEKTSADLTVSDFIELRRFIESAQS